MSHPFFRNLGFLVAGSAFATLASFALLLYFGHLVGAVGLGLIQLALAINAVFYAVADAGYSVRGLALVAKERHRSFDIVFSVITLRVTLSALLVVGVALVYGLGLLERPLFFLLFFLGLNNLFMSIALDWFFIGLNQAQVAAAFNAIQYLAAGAVVLLLTRVFSPEPWFLPLALAVGTAMGVSYPLRLFVLRYYEPPREEWPSLRSLYTYASSAIPFGVALYWLAFYQSCDAFFLNKWSGLAALGNYAVVYRLYLLFNNVSSVFFRAWLPSRSPQQDMLLDWRSLGLTLLFLTAAAVPLVFSLPFLIERGLGPEFLLAGRLSIGLLAILVLNGITQYLLYMHFLSSSLSRRLLRILFAGALVHLLLDVALVPAYGAWGALAANAGRELCMVALMFQVVLSKAAVGARV